MNSIISALLPFLGKFKAVAILVVVGGIAFLVCNRWRQTFSPAWLYVTGAVVLTAAALLVAHLLKKRGQKKMEAGLEASIVASGGQKVDLKGEIKALRENWMNSLAKLKAASGTSAATMLARLPWYIIIGEPASGKTTLLQKSGIDLPLGNQVLQGMHGTRNCEWLFSNEAIFLDTAGRYILETQDSEWGAFLTLLKRHRGKKPINGVMVALPANSLLTKTDDQLKQDGKRIRARLDELITGLGVNFPVYVLITKVDLVAGFVEFFGSLDGRYSEQIVGWTNPADADAKFDPESFNPNYEKVAERVYRMRPWLESQAAKRDLLKAFLFPEEFRYLAPPLRTVLEVVFRPNVYQETPICRGVYFSSGTQVGDPLARALEDMAKDLKIPMDFGFGPGMKEEKEVRAYFIHDLVSAQILKDKEMTWRTKQADQRIISRRRKWGLAGVGVAGLLALFSGLSWSTNRGRLGDFEVSIAEDSRPLQTAVGCLKARDDAVPPGVLDIGLNFSDEIRPSAEKSFRKVFGLGVLAPIVRDVKGPLDQGLPNSSDGKPDVRAYLETYRPWLYVRRALGEGLPKEYDAASEEEPLGNLFKVLERRNLVGKAAAADLRRCLVEYAARDPDEHVPAKERAAVDAAFVGGIDRFLTDVEKWVQRNKDATGKLKGDIEGAISGLKSECTAQRTAIVPHKAPEFLVEVARAIKRKADPYGGRADLATGGDLKGLAAGIDGREDLATLLREVKAVAPSDSDIPARIDGVIESLGMSISTEEMKAKEQARQGFIGFLDGIIRGEYEPLAYAENLDRTTLMDRQARIREETDSAGRDAWARLKSNVEALEGRELEKKDADGKVVRESGWWDTLVLLAEARRSDLLVDEYLTKGLVPHLEGGRWKKERSSDRDDQVYTRVRIDEIVLPRLREQAEFLKDLRLADSVREAGLAELNKAFADFLDAMQAYWLDQFAQALPKDRPTDLPAIYDQLRLWSAERGRLLTVAGDIKNAVFDVTRLEGPENDPFLTAQADRLARMFQTFVVFFDPTTPEVRKFFTLAQAGDAFNRLATDLEPVARGFGAGQRSRAREVAARVVAGGGGVSPFAASVEAARELKGQAAASRPSELLADWMTPIVVAAWDGVITLTADDINDEWGRVSSSWARLLASGADAFRRVFAEGGEHAKFEKDFLAPFFKIPGYQPFPTDGAGLEVIGDYTGFVETARLVGGEMFAADGSIRSDTVQVGLKIGGETPTSLRVEYVSRGGTKTSDERRTGPVEVEFSFEWSPSTCQAFNFVIGFRDGTSRRIEFSGPWAVAEAFARADRVEGNAFFWSRTDPAVGRYEVVLTARGGGVGRLFQIFTRTKGRDPLEDLASRRPERIVRIRR